MPASRSPAQQAAVRSCPRLAGKVGPAACPPRLPAAGDGVLIVNKS